MIIKLVSKSHKFLFLLSYVTILFLAYPWVKNFNYGGVNELQIQYPSTVLARFSADEIYRIQNGGATAEDETLIDHIKDQWLIGPSKIAPRFRPVDVSQEGQATFVSNLLGNKINGFFIECGAADGKLSNTRYLEMNYGWTGLLVEPNPVLFSKLLKRNRHAYTMNACLSSSNKTSKPSFRIDDLLTSMTGNNDKIHEKWLNQRGSSRSQIVQCFPLYSIALALNCSHVDYFSLDVEGTELSVLKTIPYRKLIIDVISVEYRQFDGEKILEKETLLKLRGLREFFQSTSLYNEAGILPPGDDVDGLDVVFIRKDVKAGR